MAGFHSQLKCGFALHSPQNATNIQPFDSNESNLVRMGEKSELFFHTVVFLLSEIKTAEENRFGK